MAAPPGACKRYVSAVYADKYFPEKNIAIPFKWESTPGKPKWDDDADDHDNGNANADDGGGEEVDHAAEYAVHAQLEAIEKMQEHQKLREPTYAQPPAAVASPPHANIYPLPPPPKLCPSSPLRVKDLLLCGDAHHNHNIIYGAQRSENEDVCPLHAYHHHHRFAVPWLSLIRFRALKTSTIVPIHKSFSILKPQNQITNSVGKDEASPLYVVANTTSPARAPNLQGRSQSFSHATRKYGEERGLMSCGIRAGAPQRAATERRCNSFNSLSAPHHTILEQVDDEDDSKIDQECQSAMAKAAAAAMWAGACILAAAAADNHRHENAPCRVASKLKDLMQQSANFSELGLKVQPQLAAVCGSGALAPAKKRTKSVEEEVIEAFLEESMQKSCGVELKLAAADEGAGALVEPIIIANNNISHHPLKKKRKGLLSLLKSECIGCWCPSPPY